MDTLERAFRLQTFTNRDCLATTDRVTSRAISPNGSRIADGARSSLALSRNHFAASPRCEGSQCCDCVRAFSRGARASAPPSLPKPAHPSPQAGRSLLRPFLARSGLRLPVSARRHRLQAPLARQSGLRGDRVNGLGVGLRFTGFEVTRPALRNSRLRPI
jgi:hypothetical protein